MSKSRVQRTRIDILSNYIRRTELMRAQKTPHKDVQKLDQRDVLYMRAMLHPTKKQESKDFTRTLIKFLCDQAITTAEDIYTEYGWSDKPVMKRLKLFREFGLVKREFKKYYIATPRMLQMRDEYLERLCE